MDWLDGAVVKKKGDKIASTLETSYFHNSLITTAYIMFVI